MAVEIPPSLAKTISDLHRSQDTLLQNEDRRRKDEESTRLTQLAREIIQKTESISKLIFLDGMTTMQTQLRAPVAV